MCQQALRSDVCENISFTHAIIRYDATLNLHRIGKGLSLKAFVCKEQFKWQARNFLKELSSEEQIVAAGERALAIFYNGKDDDLYQMRYNMFCDKIISSKTLIKPEILPLPHRH